MSDLVKAYTEYVSAKAEAKRNLRDEIALRTQDSLITLGAAVTEAQQDGMTVAEIARVLGIQYRNTIYDAKRAYAASKGEEADIRLYTTNTGAIPVVRTPKQAAEKPAESPYKITKIEDGWDVEAFGDEFFLSCDDDSGRLVIPEEWATASQHERDVYKQIVREIEASQ